MNKNTGFFIVMLTILVLFFTFIGSKVVTDKIIMDTILDMAKIGYYQKIVDGKVLWIKDKK
jgi:hypothetical protein